MNKNRKSAKIRLKKQQQQTMLNWSVIINCASWCKERELGKTRLLPHAKMQLVPIYCFLWWVDYALAKTFWLSKCEFLPLISYWQVVISELIFYLFWNVEHFIAADYVCWGCVISPKCLLALNNSKPFSFCPWMSLFPSMFCHAGPSSLAFLAGWLILTDSDSQIQISKKRIVA